MEKQLVSQQRRVGTRCLMYSLPETPHYARSDSHVRVPRIRPFVSSYYTMPTYGPLCSRCFIVKCSCCVISAMSCLCRGSSSPMPVSREYVTSVTNNKKKWKLADDMRRHDVIAATL